MIVVAEVRWVEILKEMIEVGSGLGSVNGARDQVVLV